MQKAKPDRKTNIVWDALKHEHALPEQRSYVDSYLTLTALSIGVSVKGTIWDRGHRTSEIPTGAHTVNNHLSRTSATATLPNSARFIRAQFRPCGPI
jgi:hypothetical protein